MTFYSVLNDAINDMLEHGYDSDDRVVDWQERLKVAAETYIGRGPRVEGTVRAALYQIYQRMVGKYGVLKRHPGLGKWNIDRVKPSLRAELDRRILAAVSLIKLNRAEAVPSILRSFVGWSTSIPVGGTAEPDRQEAKKAIKKSLSSLPFETRRVNIDQGAKLVAAINDIVATDNGAIAAVWKSHKDQVGYDSRPDHNKRDGKVYLIRDNAAQKLGLVKPGTAGYLDQITQPGEEPFCRCSVSYIYHIGSLPVEMLTVLGVAKLAEIREQRRKRA